MSDSLLPNLLRALGVVVVERLPNSAFHLLTPPPDWMADVVDATESGAQGTIGGRFPFLDQFLQQAEAAWHEGGSETAASGPFTAVVEGDELLLRAMALTVSHRKLLVIERLTGESDPRPFLQKAREHRLEHEQITRQIAHVQSPAAAVHEGLEQLQGLSLTAEQRAVVERIVRASQEVQAAMASLPSEPRRLRRQVRPS